MTGPVPCTILTGALGSGKTTAIHTLMQRPEMEGTALIINEFGEVGLDHLLVSSAVETTLLMENGCMCCSLRGDLVDTVLSLFDSVTRGKLPPFRRILIETTGLADPVPILRDLTAAEILRDRVVLTGVTTCVDGLIGRAGLRDNPVAVAQVAQADTCLITKCDLADPLALDQLAEALSAINPMMTVLRVMEGDLPPTEVVLAGGTRVNARPEGSGGHVYGHDQAGHHHEGHDHAHLDDKPAGPHAGIESWSTLIERPLPWAAFRDWFDLVYSLHAARMLRMKGILWVEELERPLLVQAVGPVVAPLRLLDTWPDGWRQTRLVLIARDLPSEVLARSFKARVLHG